jgi:hypothetical protein
MKIFNFFILNFRGIFQFFSFPSCGMANFFKFQNRFFNFFPISLCWYGQIFFQNSKTKIFILDFKNETFFKIFHFKFSCGIKEFFPRSYVATFIKRLKNYLFSLIKIAIYCIPPPVVHRKRAPMLPNLIVKNKTKQGS